MPTIACCPTATTNTTANTTADATAETAALASHPAYRIARHRLHMDKRRDDFTVTAITFGPRHRFEVALNFWPHTMVNDGDCSIAVEYHFATSPNRPRRDIFNIHATSLRPNLWDILNAAVGT